MDLRTCCSNKECTKSSVFADFKEDLVVDYLLAGPPEEAALTAKIYEEKRRAASARAPRRASSAGRRRSEPVRGSTALERGSTKA